MSVVQGKLENGRIVLATPVDWPEGTEVRVQPVCNGDASTFAADLQGDDPESIARWLAWYDTLEPLVFTPEEEAALQAARWEAKQSEKATFAQRAEKLRELFE